MGTISNTRTHLQKNNTHAHLQSHAQGRASGNQSLRIPPVAAIITNLTPPQPHGNSNKWKHTFSTLVSTTGGGGESPAATHMATPVATPPAVFSSGFGNTATGGTFSTNNTNYNYNYANSSNITSNNNNNDKISSTASSGDSAGDRGVVVKKPTPKVFQCCGYGDCSMIFSRKFFLERHIRMHKGEKPFQCDVCFKHFSRNDNLKQHKHSVHKDKESETKTNKVAEEPVTTTQTEPLKQIGSERKRRASGGEETQETKRKSRAKNRNATGTDKDKAKNNKNTTPELSITGDVICDADGRPLVVQPMIVTKDSLDTLLHEQHKSAHKRRGTLSSSPDATVTTAPTTSAPGGSVKATEKKKSRNKNTTKNKEKTRGEVKHEPRDDSDGDGANTKISIASLIT